ncbi:MAG: flagellar hook-basal body complex protein FliE [Candidatus Kapabacteria bacterium]|nr:flagellar hook-basal body complex protein FliE [Ignavibacteriota bacterium]MCW5886044.1 flagellar hook-basal body complex protein FliE [Candidatus Kapabacteria bacterium]
MIEGIGLGGGIIPGNVMKAAGLDNIDPKNFNPESMMENLSPGLMDNFKNDNTNRIGNANQDGLKITPPNTGSIGYNNKGGFAETLKELVSDVNSLQKEAGNKTEAFIRGEPIDLHDVMIASNKAATSFKLLLELRNKGLDLYREVSRMQ